MNEIGLGTWLITEYEELKLAIKTALEAGYRTIDTAQVYDNEAKIGSILKEMNVDTNELFIITKVSPINYRYHTTKSVLQSLENLQIESIDLVLLHAELETEDNLKAYKELIKLKEKGLVKNIGLSNFSQEGIEALVKATGMVPYCNQIVCSPTTRPEKLEKYCKEQDILLMGYSILKPYYTPNPFYQASGMSEEEKNIIEDIASKYNSSVSQVLNGWALYNGYHIIPKSTKPERIKENYNINIDFEEEDITKINSMNKLTAEEYKLLVESWKTYISEDQMIKGM